ncbi:MAG TPA: alpha/beta fold hydrolase [bacterium]|nr:alpha/beta fold hydrolase [bacterium]
MQTALSLVSEAGKGLRRTLAKVNPDVWREALFTTAQAYSLVLPRREQVIDRGPDDYLPVILVHGLGGNRGGWLPLRWYLRLMGHRRLYAFGYEEGAVAELAAGLAEFIEQVRRETGQDRVDIVAHSLGGLVARYAIQRLGFGPHVRTLITMATPHRGTYAAQYADTPITRELRPDSSLLAELNGDDWQRYPTRLVTVYSDRDIYVVPAEHMVHAQAERVLLPGISHTQYLVSPEAFRAVAARLPQREA